ncbi:MAG: YbaY family lipoprotein [Halioglobus sp.]
MMGRRYAAGFFVAVVALSGLAGCGAGGDDAGGIKEQSMARIEGAVTYRERMMLPPGAKVEVQLQDISRADALATVLETLLFTPEGGPPYPFSIDYDSRRIDERMRYALRATISVGETMMFTSTEYIDPFSGNPVEILVQRVAEPVRHQGPGLEGQPWLLQNLNGEPANLGASDRPVDIQFLADDMRVAGFSGCNRYSGAYSRDGTSAHGSPIMFGPMAGTMMACAEGAELEQTYLQLLAKVTAFRIQGETLLLLSGDTVLASYRLQ